VLSLAFTGDHNTDGLSWKYQLATVDVREKVAALFDVCSCFLSELIAHGFWSTARKDFGFAAMGCGESLRSEFGGEIWS
jgi:hypothetical protein